MSGYLIGLGFVLFLLGAALVCLGYELAVDHLSRDRGQLDQQQALMAAEWKQLDRIRRIPAVLFATQRAMQTEEDHYASMVDLNREGLQ